MKHKRVHQIGTPSYVSLIIISLSNLLHLLEVGVLNVIGAGLIACVGLSTALEACVAWIESCAWSCLTSTSSVHLLRSGLHGFVETIDGCVNLSYITTVLGFLEGFDG